MAGNTVSERADAARDVIGELHAWRARAVPDSLDPGTLVLQRAPLVAQACFSGARAGLKACATYATQVNSGVNSP